MINILRIVVTDVERAGAAIVHEIEALPGQVEHVFADLFKLTAKLWGPAAIQEAMKLAKLAESQYLAPAVERGVTVIEHTQAFEWVKGELLANPELGLSLPDAHSLAGLALSWLLKGIDLAGADAASSL